MSEGNGNGARSELPEGWEWKRLGEVAAIQSGQAVPSSTYTDDETGTPFLQGNAEFGDLRPTPIKKTSAPKVMTDERAVLISVRAPVGATNLAPGSVGIGRGLAAITPGEGLDQQFLLWALRNTRSVLERQATGTTFPAITGKVLGSHPLPVPPLEEQRRIASTIERWMSALANGEAGLAVSLARLDQFEASLVAAAFSEAGPASFSGDSVPQPAGHTAKNRADLITLGQLCERVAGRIQTGPFGSQLHASDYRDAGTPLVMPKDLDYGRISTKTIARIGTGDAERLARHAVEPGDILQSRRGDLRRRALVTENEKGWICGTGCFVIRLRDVELAHYVMEHLAEPTTARFIDQRAAGVTMPNLNRRILGDVPLRVPSSEGQRDILALTQAQLGRARDLKAPVQVARQQLDRLRRSILHKAFIGELQTQRDGRTQAYT